MSHASSGPSQAHAFVDALKANDFDFFAGVPCSLLKGLVSILDADESAHYVSATREDSAIGMAVGAYLGGRRPMVLMQNSGLGVSVNALASLSTMYELPALLVISWRGEPSLNDAPEHILMGEIMLPILDLLKIPYRVLAPGDPVAPHVTWAKTQMDATRKPVALVAPAGVLVKKLEAVEALVATLDERDLVVCCNGMLGRELYTVKDRPQNFYMIGSMGLAASIGLGLCLARPKRRIIVLDGDGNVLMGLNALASVGSERPVNLLHVVLDNHAHASTGGQRTISDEIHLESAAGAVGYRATHRATDIDAFNAALRAARTQPGPVIVLGVVEGGNVKGIGRVKETPPELTARFRAEACR